MDLIEAAKRIKKEDGVFMWTGPAEEAEVLRDELWGHWEKCAGTPLAGSRPVNMHEDWRCVDRRYLTTDPESWEAPKKRKEKSDD